MFRFNFSLWLHLWLAMVGLAQFNALAQETKPAGRLASNEQLSERLVAIVQEQAADWNRGDIPAFMSAYWKSEKLTFCGGGKTTRGWIATRDRYLKRYPDQKTMGKLTFSELEVEQLDTNAALMLGRWRLDRDEPASGNFSLVWRKIDGDWLIVHDHSSSDEE